MADELDDPTDPTAQLIERHLIRMQEIADEGFGAAKAACGSVLQRVQRNVNLHDAVLDKTLTALGVNEPEDKTTNDPS